MKSIKQTFGIIIVALALFGAYTLLVPKKPVDDRISDDFRAELAEEGILLSDEPDTGGKSMIFNSLNGAPSLSASLSGQKSSAPPAALFGGTTPSSSAPAPQYGNQAEDFTPDDAPSWNGGGETTAAPAPVLPSLDTPSAELPSLDIPTFDETPTPPAPPAAQNEITPLPDFDDAPLFDVTPPAAAPTTSTMPEITTPVTQITPQISDSELFAFEPITPTAAPEGASLDTSSAFTPVDTATAVDAVPVEAVRIDPLDLTPSPDLSELSEAPITYNQRAPGDIPGQLENNVRDVKPLPPVTEGGVMSLASGTIPAPQTQEAPAPAPAPTGDFAFSNGFEPPMTQELPQPAIATHAPPTSAPGVARSYRQRATSNAAESQPTDTPVVAYNTVPSTQSIDPFTLPTEQLTPTNTQNVHQSAPQNPMSQNTVRPEILQQIASIKNVLNDENADYRVGHKMITDLYLSDLNFAERELVLPIADKCGWAAFFAVRVFDPYEWKRTIKPTDTLQTLSAENGVSPELILKINRLESPNQLMSGKDGIKIPKGPFDATIFLARKELVVTSNGLFACRFRIGIGSPEILSEAVYNVKDEIKFEKPRYFPSDEEVIEPGDPRNPLGTHWIGLDQEIGIHGTNNLSCIGTDQAQVEGFSLDNRDIAELYDILTTESRVRIVR